MKIRHFPIVVFGCLAASILSLTAAHAADFQWPNGARSIYFRDPAGNSIEIAEPRLWFDED